MNRQQLWRQVNAQLAAKIIGECSYEESLCPQPLGEGRYQLALASGRRYEFCARETVWSWLRVDAPSLRREGMPVTSAVQLLIDAQQELALSDITLGVLIEEIHNTLYSEVQRQQRIAGLSARDMVAVAGPQLQALLDAHPKALANKGRMGWGAEDLQRYSPESASGFQLRLVALHRDRVNVAVARGVSEAQLLAQLVTGAEQQRLQQRMAEAGLCADAYLLMPVHPWQWQRFIVSQYGEWLADGTLVDLGIGGDRYLPQQSIRTLANIARPGCCDIKLALSILNTSCYRGVPGDSIAAGVQLTPWLRAVIAADPVLQAAQLTVQGDLAGVHCLPPGQQQIAGTPYRYVEMLGAVWRESLEAELRAGESGVLMSTLMQTDSGGRALVCEYVADSGLSAEQWLRELFDAVVVPLYHLMCAYGVGVVAHGQNISVVLRNGRPQRAVLKDFHGDLRLVDQPFAQLQSMPTELLAALPRLPAQHLLHDLVTGHFVTTLRFISPLFEEQLQLPESAFYRLLADCLRDYQAAQPQLAERHRLFPLFSKELDKVCINRVRFRIGYQDSAARPLPELGSAIANPLCLGEQP